jgi:uncharacterized membrane protein (Fun14 family)
MEPENANDTVDTLGEANPLWDIFGPLLPQMGFGGVLGWAVGFFAKKSLKVVAIIVAFIFIMLQVMGHFGYIDVNFVKMGDDFSHYANEDFFSGIWGFLTHNLPFGGSFVIGFLLGFKMG